MVARGARNSGNAAFWVPEIANATGGDHLPFIGNSIMRFPFGWRHGFHRQRMDFVGLDPRTQRGIHHLVTRDRSLALEGVRHNGGKPVATITLEFAMHAVQSGGDDGFEFVGSHISVGVVSYLDFDQLRIL